MTARVALWELLADDSGLNALGIDRTTLFNTNSVDSPEARPFAAIRWAQTFPEFGLIKRQSFSVWVHDKGKDYSRIDLILKRIDAILTDAVHVEGSDGSKISTFDDQGASDDLIDDGYGTITRNTTWQALPR